MRKIFVFLFLFFVFSLNHFAQSAITKSDYEIYGEILRDLRRADAEKSKGKYSFVILGSTETGKNSPEIYKDKKYSGLNRDFNRRNRTSLTFKKIFPVKYQYELLNRLEVEKLLDEGNKGVGREKEAKEKSEVFQSRVNRGDISWKRFYEKYPTSNGFYRFSAIGYSRDKKFAVVTTEAKGDSWSRNTEYLFKKIKNKWVIFQSGSGFSVA